MTRASVVVTQNICLSIEIYKYDDSISPSMIFCHMSYLISWKNCNKITSFHRRDSNGNDFFGGHYISPAVISQSGNSIRHIRLESTFVARAKPGLHLNETANFFWSSAARSPRQRILSVGSRYFKENSLPRPHLRERMKPRRGKHELFASVAEAKFFRSRRQRTKQRSRLFANESLVHIWTRTQPRRGNSSEVLPPVRRGSERYPYR